MTGTLGDRDLVGVAAATLDEDPLERTVRGLGFRIEHRGAAAENAEPTWRDRRELPGLQGRAAQRLHACGCLRSGAQRQPTDQHRHGECKQCDRRVDAQWLDATGDHRRHFAVVVQPTERQHHPEQQPDGQEHREIAYHSEPDEIEHHGAGETALGRPRQHRRQLVGQQDHQQHGGHGQPGDQYLAQQITGQDPRQDRSSTGKRRETIE